MKQLIVGFFLIIGVCCIVSGDRYDNEFVVVVGIGMLWIYHYIIYSGVKK